MRLILLAICLTTSINITKATDTLFVSMDGVEFTSIQYHQSWTTATWDLQKAIDSLHTTGGGQVWVRSGFYFPSDTDRTISFYPRNNVQVYGGFCGYETSIAERPGADRNENDTIEPWEFFCESMLMGNIGSMSDSTDNSYHVIDGTGTDSTAVFDGFKITGGNCSLLDGRGGGAKNAFLQNCILENNYAYQGGGAAISCKIFNSLIFRNRAFNGGGTMYSILKNCRIIMNTAFYGGGSFGDTIFNSIVDMNKANHRGGGTCSSILFNCIVSNNFAKEYGGGISTDFPASSEAYNCLIMNNQAKTGGGSNKSKLYNCKIINNKSYRGGGGSCQDFALNSLILNNQANFCGATLASDLMNCTVANNKDTLNPTDWESRNIQNCIFWNNTMDSAYAYKLSSSASTIKSNASYYIKVELLTDGSNVKFKNPSDSIGNVVTKEGLEHILNADWSLDSGSVCINAGYIWPWDILDEGVRVFFDTIKSSLFFKDYYGNERIIDSIIDMGAIEHQFVYPKPSSIFKTSINENIFRIYPTVTSESIIIKSQSDKEYNLWIHGINGILVNEEKNLIGDYILNLQYFSRGIYVVKLQLKNKAPEIFKIVKE